MREAEEEKLGREAEEELERGERYGDSSDFGDGGDIGMLERELEAMGSHSFDLMSTTSSLTSVSAR